VERKGSLRPRVNFFNHGILNREEARLEMGSKGDAGGQDHARKTWIAFFDEEIRRVRDNRTENPLVRGKKQLLLGVSR